MEEHCDICGDVGVIEAIIICCKCNRNSEHMYCMKTPLKKRIDWICEDCEFSSKASLLASPTAGELPCTSKLSNSVEVCNVGVKSEEKKELGIQFRKKRSFHWEKKVTTGKTKYICAEEAILISSGANKSFFKRDLDARPPGKRRTQRFGSLDISKAETHKKLSGGNGHNYLELGTCNVKNVNKNLLPDSEKRTYAPALGASWQGSFSIHDLRRGNLTLHIHAYNPSRVRKNVYEFSKRMPEVLHFELVSCKKFWIHFFHEYFPDRRDIGLYFFSSDTTKRSSEFISLLESMNVENLALRKQIDEIELLVFTSKLLPVPCQLWQGKYFLWGVFHRLKLKPPQCRDDKLLKLSNGANEGDNSEEADMDIHMLGGGDNSEEADMDIDMLGGVLIGPIDVPVQKQPLKRLKRGGFKPFGANKTP